MSEEMNEDPEPSMKDYDGPCREKAQTILRRRASEFQRRAIGLNALADFLDEAERKCLPFNFPGEEVLWDFLCRINF